MNKLIYPRHVMTNGDGFMYVLSLAGEKIKSIKYQTKYQASCEAELFKYYVRSRYGTKLSTMRPSLPEEDLRAYTAEMGYELNPRSIEIHFPRRIRELFEHCGAEIGRNLAELELPSTKQVIVRETLREARLERESLKRQRLELRDRLSKERAVVWREAQKAVALAWHDAKADLEDLREVKDELGRLKDGIKRTDGCMILDGNDMYDWGWIPISEMNAKCRAKYGSVPSQKTPLGGALRNRVSKLESCLQSALDVGYPDNGWQAVAEELLDTSLDQKRTPLGGVEVTREQALAGLGDEAVWDAEKAAIKYFGEFAHLNII